MHREVPGPQDDPGLLHLLAGQPAVRTVRVEDDAVLEREAEVARWARVALDQMLALPGETSKD
jgi:hypothetical protein